MDGDRNDDTDAFRDRMQNRNRRKRPIRDEISLCTDHDAGDRSQSRSSRSRTDEISGPVEKNGSGDSSSNGTVNMLPPQDSQPYAATRLTSSAARETFGHVAVPPAIFSARGFPDPSTSRTEADMLHPEPESGQFHPSLMHAQGTLQTCQERPGLHLNNPDAADTGVPSVLQQQLQIHHALQQRNLIQDALQQQQEMQHTTALSAAGGFATHFNPFSERNLIQDALQQHQQQMQNSIAFFAAGGFATHVNPFSEWTNDVSATTADASLREAFSSSLPPFVSNDPSLLQRHSRAPLSFLLSDDGLSAAFARPSIDAERDSSRPPAVMPSARLRASAAQILLDGLQTTVDHPFPFFIPKPRTEDLYMSCDNNVLSVHQIIVRKQIEFFVARQEDIDNFTSNRRKEISIGQVGIRCKHCAVIPHNEVSRGAVYFPSTLRALYQAAQNMAAVHFTDTCRHINPQLKVQLIDLQKTKAVVGYGGKKYWAEKAGERGIYETEEGLRFHHGH